MINSWDNDINHFLHLANTYNVRMIMVGGGAVNFHGYQRHSADVDFWIEPSEENFKKLVLVFKAMEYEIDDFPEAVKRQEQNISVKFSPNSLYLELITNFSVNKSFEEAFQESEIVENPNDSKISWRVLSYPDLLTSKIKAGRAKDLLDVQELQKIKSGN